MRIKAGFPVVFFLQHSVLLTATDLPITYIQDPKTARGAVLIVD